MVTSSSVAGHEDLLGAPLLFFCNLSVPASVAAFACISAVCLSRGRRTRQTLCWRSVSERSEAAVTAGPRQRESSQAKAEQSIPPEPERSQKFQQGCWIFGTPGRPLRVSRVLQVNLRVCRLWKESPMEAEGGRCGCVPGPDLTRRAGIFAAGAQLFSAGPSLRGCARPGLETHPRQDGASPVSPAQRSGDRRENQRGAPHLCLCKTCFSFPLSPKASQHSH